MSLYTKEAYCWGIMVPDSERRNFFSAIRNGCHFRLSKCNSRDGNLVQICDGSSQVRLRSYDLMIEGTEYIYYHVTNDDRRKIVKYLGMHSISFIMS